MFSATEPFRISTNLLLDCALVSLAFVSLWTVSKYISASKTALSEQQVEYQESDINALNGQTISGADVANVVRKYKQDYNFILDTRSGSRTITVNDPFVNDAAGTGYVPVDSWFDCSVTRNLNGNVTSIDFKERGDSLSVSEISDVTEMRQLIVSIINNPAVDMSSSWAEIQEYLENNLIDSSTREALLTAIPNSSEDDSWSELVTKIIDTVGELQNKPAAIENGASTVVKGTVSRNSYTDLPSVPGILLVSAYGDEEFLFCDGAWYQIADRGSQRIYAFGKWYTVQNVDVSDRFSLNGTRLINLTGMAISYQYTTN